MQRRSKRAESGIGFIALLLVLAIFGLGVVSGMKLMPSLTEYMAVKKAIVAAGAAGTTPAEVRAAFDRQAEVNDIRSISGKDLEITRAGGANVVSFAYQKKIPLTGSASLLIDYQGSTAPQVTDSKTK